MQLAVSICETCPVKQKCLDHSLLWEAEGIWGGKTARERHIIRKQNKIAILMVPTRVRR
jgi:hypothetical protein